MSLPRSRVEQQLSRAKEELGVWTKALDDQGVKGTSHRADPRWRTLNSRVRQIMARLRTVAEVEKVNADCETRKAERAAAAEAPPEPKPAAKAKKDKGGAKDPAAKEGGKKDGGGKKEGGGKDAKGAKEPKKDKKPKE